MTTELTVPPNTKAVREVSKSGKIGKRLQSAIDKMVWQGHHRDDAAKASGMLPKSLYNSLRKHHVRQYYLSQLEVLRTSARARSFHRLEALAAQDENKNAAVNAIRVMEQLTDTTPHAGPVAVTPGVVIVLTAPPQPQPAAGMVIDVGGDDATYIEAAKSEA